MSAAATVAREDFEFIRGFVRQQAAIALEDGKEYLVRSRLTPLARRHALDGIPGLVAEVRRRPASALAGEVLDAMTTNETSFFRDGHPFESLRETVLPQLLDARRQQRRLRIWCGASSSGQEPWTLALVLRHHFPWLATWDVSIHATDISRAMLARASEAVYSDREVGRGLPRPLRDRHFHRHGDGWRPNDDLRELVTFSRLNLSEPFPPTLQADLIVLRNVLIYFDPQTKASILTRARRQLADDGYLLLGGAETVGSASDAFDRVLIGRSVWYRAA